MKGHEKRHAEDRLQAWLDGELAEVEADAVRSHIDECGRCAKALEEVRAVISALLADADVRPLRPMWPAVKAAMSPETRPRFGLSFGFATSLAAAAGLVIGLALGLPDEPQQQAEETDSLYNESILGDDYALTLDQIYVSAFEENGE